MLSAFSIKNGTFRLKYQQGFVSSLTFPFQSKTDGNYSVLESLSPVNSPSKRRANLKDIPKREITVPLSDLLSAYETAFKRRLTDDFRLYVQKKTDDERRAYLKQYVFSKITDTVKEGIIGESIYLKYMETHSPAFQFNDPKIGLNSFDAVHVRRLNPAEANSPIQRIFISEVKYAANGKPLLGVIKLNNKEWRQLSLPYVKNKLDKMATHTEGAQRLAAEILAHPETVKLRLVVFNPDAFSLNIYPIGDMLKSHLD